MPEGAGVGVAGPGGGVPRLARPVGPALLRPGGAGSAAAQRQRVEFGLRRPSGQRPAEPRRRPPRRRQRRPHAARRPQQTAGAARRVRAHVVLALERLTRFFGFGRRFRVATRCKRRRV